LHFIYSLFFTASPPKDYGVHVSDQLNTLRTLLETRLKEQDDIGAQTKDLSILQSSPGTFTKEFLQSYQQSKYKNNPNDLVSDLDDDEQERKGNYDYYDKNKTKYQSDILSTASSNQYESSLVDQVNQANVRSSATASSTSTMPSNFVDRINTRK
jgi:hypothetical protein